MSKLIPPNKEGLKMSVANVTAEAVRFDWTDANDEESGEPIFEIEYPTITWAILREYFSDELTEYLVDFDHIESDDDLNVKAFLRDHGDDEADEEAREKFEGTRAHDEWRDSYFPMMSFYWPVDLAYGVSVADAADLMDEFAPTCTLVTFGDDRAPHPEYVIALSGGGMNLADQLAAAYLCCGCVPPLGLLTQLSGVIDDYKRDQIGDALKEAYKLAAIHMRYQADRLDEESAHVFKESK